MVKLVSNFTRICTNVDGLQSCVCDFRVNISECAEEAFLRISFRLLLIFIAATMLISFGSLLYQICFKRQSLFFPPSKERGILRPQPANAFYVTTGLFCLLYGFDIILLLTESYDNVALAEIGYAIPRLLLLSMSTLYPISLIYATTSFDPSKIFISWARSTRALDIIGVSMMLGPLVSVLPLTYITGHNADIENFKSANNLLKLQFFLIGIWELGYTIATILVWSKLNTLMRNYAKELREYRRIDHRWKLWKARRFKWRLTAIFALLACTYFASSISSFAFVFIARNPSTWRQGTAAFFMLFWNYMPILAMLLVQIVIICRRLILVPSQPLHQSPSRRSSHYSASMYRGNTAAVSDGYRSDDGHLIPGWMDFEAENGTNISDPPIELTLNPTDPTHAAHGNIGVPSSSRSDSNPTPFSSPLRGSNIWDVDRKERKKLVRTSYRRERPGKEPADTTSKLPSSDYGSGTISPSPVLVTGLDDPSTKGKDLPSPKVDDGGRGIASGSDVGKGKDKDQGDDSESDIGRWLVQRPLRAVIRGESHELQHP
jgi:hypothetical protein